MLCGNKTGFLVILSWCLVVILMSETGLADRGALDEPSRQSSTTINDDEDINNKDGILPVGRGGGEGRDEEEYHPPGALGLEWKGLCCKTKGQGKLNPARTLLNYVSGKAKPGRLLALMGPSGSGKTTLLNTLSGQLPYQSHWVLTGQVYVTEEEEDEATTDAGKTRSSFKCPINHNRNQGYPRGGGSRGGGRAVAEQSGFVFVKQENLFYSHLTVREVLMFTARLRLPKDMSQEERESYVDEMTARMGLTIRKYVSSERSDSRREGEVREEMIARMGLKMVADTLVGDEKKRGISGGERKRLSLACELMGNPSKIVFADEPTSGLDSFQAQMVMNSMKKLCDDGHTVIVSIHQPRSTVYQVFDDIMLLSDGNVIYHGSAKQVTKHFASLGHPCPLHFNPAEFLLDLVSIDHSSAEARELSSRRVEALAQAYRTGLKTAPASTSLTIASEPTTRKIRRRPIKET